MMNGIATIWHYVRKGLKLTWRMAVVYPGLGAGIAQGLVSSMVILAPMWSFPPPQKVQMEAYLLGFLGGIFYGLFAERRRLRRRSTHCPANKRADSRTE